MIDAVLSAFMFLTVLPVGRLAQNTSPQPGKMFSFFPLVGLVVGIMVYAVDSITFLPRDLSAFVALVLWVALTGGLHLDGLADSCDGLLATVSAERRLEIMKDPRAGSWAVIGVALVLLGKWVALRTLSPASLLIVPVIGRWSMVLATAAFPPARSVGLAAQFRVGFGRTQILIASLITVFLAILCSLWLGWRLLAVIAIAPVIVLGIGRWAAARLGGGLTGDVYGALCELTELVCLICLNIS